MKKFLKGISIACIAALLLIGCTSDDNDMEYSVKGIELFDSEEEVMELIGEPHEEVNITIEEQEYDVYIYSGFEVVLQNDQVVAFLGEEVMSKSENIKTGSEQQFVEETYEDKDHMTESNSLWVKEENTLITFTFKDGAVELISYSDLNTMNNYLNHIYGKNIDSIFEDGEENMVNIGDSFVAAIQQNSVQDFAKLLEEVVTLEHDRFLPIQSDLSKAVKKEMELYEEIGTIRSLTDLAEVAEKAIESAETRRGLMEEEKQIIAEAFQAFQDGIYMTRNINDEQLLEIIQELDHLFQERYDAYNALYDAYIETIDLDIELYKAYSAEATTIEELKKKHDTVNEAYREINKLNDLFNEATEKYNKGKQEFYEMTNKE